MIVVALVSYILLASGSESVNNSECYSISDFDATKMVLGDLRDGFSSGRLEAIYREKSVDEVKISSIERNAAPKGSGLAYVKLVISNIATGERVGTALIFEDCDIEWRK